MPPSGRDPHAAERTARRLVLNAVFEAEFGQRNPLQALERALGDGAFDEPTAAHARWIVQAVVRERQELDDTIARVAPTYPVLGLARIDRAILRSALGEVLHCPATPTRVAIAEWVELARTYSGEPARRLVNGVLGSVSRESAGPGSAINRKDRTARGA